MSNSSSSNYQITLYGYCQLTPREILEKFTTEGVKNLNYLSGEYVIILENKQLKECYIITSAHGICQYYYTLDKNQFYHSDTVLGVLEKSGINWEWNWEALANLSLLDHVLENETLHPNIYRVSQGSILHFYEGKLKTTTLTWDDLHPPIKSTPENALNIFNQEIAHWMKNHPVCVSISGGFDSRLILSSVIKNGVKPLLVTMGNDHSTDVIISRQIAQSLALELHTIPLSIEQYLQHGEKISVLTNGTKTFRHWHTYLYTYEAKLSSNYRFFIGTNGEFARTFYYDFGRKSLLKNFFESEVTLTQLWQQKLRSIFTPDELKSFNPQFSQQFTQEKQQQRLERIKNLCHQQFLPGLDRFYLENRVKNFMGNGLKLYSDNVFWIAPFLNKEWVSIMWRLNRNWKLGSNWHRFAIEKNLPELLNFPEEGKSAKMYSKAPKNYWENNPKYPIIAYGNYAQWLQSDLITEFLLDQVSLIADLVEKNTVISIIDNHKEKLNRTNAIALLLSMIFWKINRQKL